MTPKPITATRFVELLTKADASAAQLARALELPPHTVRAWTKRGVPADNAEATRAALADKELLASVKQSPGRKSGLVSMTASRFSALVQASGLTNGELGAMFDVHPDTIARWKLDGIPFSNDRVAKTMEEKFASMSAAKKISGSQLAAIMDERAISVNKLAEDLDVTRFTVTNWRRDGVPAKWSRIVHAHLNGDTDAPKIPKRAGGRVGRAPADAIVSEPIEGKVFAKMLADLNLTQTAAAAIFGVTQTTVSQWARGHVPGTRSEHVRVTLEQDGKVTS